MEQDNPENNPPPDPFAGWTQERRNLAVQLDAILQGNMTIDQLLEAGVDVAALQIPRPVSYTHLTLPTNREV